MTLLSVLQLMSGATSQDNNKNRGLMSLTSNTSQTPNQQNPLHELLRRSRQVLTETETDQQHHTQPEAEPQTQPETGKTGPKIV